MDLGGIERSGSCRIYLNGDNQFEDEETFTVDRVRSTNGSPRKSKCTDTSKSYTESMAPKCCGTGMRRSILQMQMRMHAGRPIRLIGPPCSRTADLAALRAQHSEVREPLLKTVAAVPRRRNGRLGRACCNK